MTGTDWNDTLDRLASGAADLDCLRRRVGRLIEAARAEASSRPDTPGTGCLEVSVLLSAHRPGPATTLKVYVDRVELPRAGRPLVIPREVITGRVSVRDWVTRLIEQRREEDRRPAAAAGIRRAAARADEPRTALAAVPRQVRDKFAEAGDWLSTSP
ncbi:hypothetical protein [Bailinhaonella thermotolerans]|uniref:Uncharacterized protein n=1 Tax=Bailinhaonella thermotolerans TaxID=1070861 RepID=A0A3A4AD57_9ACTN|nr:hypothetical protein [Bailinhaonella thermotolerans]RJL23990.1 hypothetical protein D5H75_31655 [Bailinhaonella thermotolerans]